MKKIERICLAALTMLTWGLAQPDAHAQKKSREDSQAGEKSWQKTWVAEYEAHNYRVTQKNDTIEIWTSKGFTLWHKEKLQAPIKIEYYAQVVMENDSDRLSDLNCFWMASDPLEPKDILARRAERSGVFVRCYALQLYYMGYGGNGNKTTRFRRYDGDEDGIVYPRKRPKILKEYTDAAHLLKANHWYHIEIDCNADGTTTYSIDGEKLVEYKDENPLKEGWFGFRTTKSRTRITGFKATPAN